MKILWFDHVEHALSKNENQVEDLSDVSVVCFRFPSIIRIKK